MSLTGCIQKAGDKLRAADKSAILAGARKNRQAGMDVREAAFKSIDDQIKAVATQLAAAMDQARSPTSVASSITESKARDSSPEKIFGKRLAPLAIKAYESLSPKTRNAVDSWNVNWHTGRLDKAFRNNDDMAAEVRAAFEPVREELRRVYGDTVPAYRGQKNIDAGEGVDAGRALLSWTPLPKIAESFAINRTTGMPKPITDDRVNRAVEQFERIGRVTWMGNHYAKVGKGKDTYHQIYSKNGYEHQTDGENADIANTFRDDQRRRNEWIAELRSKGAVYQASIPVDKIEWIPTNLNLKQPEFIARFNPLGGDGDKVSWSAARDPQPAFYSQLQRAIEGVPDRLATMAAPQWKLWLDANAAKLGVKKDEIEWSGVKDYLTVRGKDKVTREEIAGYLGENGVKVKEVVLGGDSALTTAEQAEMTELLDLRRRYDEGDEGAYSLEDANRLEELMQGRMTDARNPAVPKYANYTVPGGENYREMLITLPVKMPAIKEWTSAQIKSDRAKLEDGGFSSSVIDDAIGYVEREGDSHAALERASKERNQPVVDLLRTLRNGAKIKQANEIPSTYKSSHFDQPNILAHLRVDDRTDAEGKKTLFIQELQSDFGQDFKKAKAAISKAVDTDFEGIVKTMQAAGILEVVCD